MQDVMIPSTCLLRRRAMTGSRSDTSVEKLLTTALWPLQERNRPVRVYSIACQRMMLSGQLKPVTGTAAGAVMRVNLGSKSWALWST